MEAGLRSDRSIKRVCLALQGGGAHGAFTWGVLDRILEDDRIEIAAISGTSAGALNGAALKVGLHMGGRKGARENLDWLWEQVAALGDWQVASWLQALLPAPAAMARMAATAFPFSTENIAAQLYSPQSLGAFYRNPLERIVKRFHFDKVCASEGPALHVAATNVRTGKIRVFTGAEITANALLASACLPTIFQTIEMEDTATGKVEAYWDGGYAGNPALFPLFGADLPDDIVIVNINPLMRDELPFTATEIQSRLNEISFNSSLMRELRAIAFVKRMIADGTLPKGRMKDPRVHMIADDDLMNRLSVASKTSATPSLLLELKAAGRAAADAFLDDHRDDLNERDTLDLVTLYG